MTGRHARFGRAPARAGVPGGTSVLAASRAGAATARAGAATALALLVAALLVLLLASSALAGGLGRWTDLTGSTGSTQTRAAAVRAADGGLEVVWIRDTPGGSTYDLCARTVAAGGSFGSVATIIPAWQLLASPAVALDAGAPRVFVAGRDSFGAGGTHSGMCTALRGATGAWTLDAGTIDDKSAGDTTSSAAAFAATRPGAAPLVGWWGGGIYVHAGLDPAQPQYAYQAQFAANGGYYPTLAVEGASGRAYLGWTSIAAGHTGLYVQEVASDGAPVGTPQLLPGCAAIYDGGPHFILMPEATPLTGRPGRAGLFAAYPTGGLNPDTIRVWKVGGGSTVVTSGQEVTDRAAIAADGAGRVWVVWASHGTSGGAPITLCARRSNASVTRWGAPVQVKPPKAGLALFALLASAQDGKLDLLAHFAPYLEGADGATWHTQLTPGMTVTCSKARLPLHQRVAIKVTVRDAGVPLKGATVHLAGRTARTGGTGVATLTVGPFPRAATLTATVARGGYAEATLTIKAR